ncbi:MAG: ATP synthase F1 subunit epsilon [Bacteroidia bacterium]|nr:ATP synthase F1 subunit epsilon [Bacteroidia bacterium]MDW8303083.1 ATP synthase F1 subunit epsilon [Bacteroidia bacterium]
MFVEIISPERIIFQGDAESVKLPGAAGSFEVKDKHAPIISTLSKGDLSISQKGKSTTFKIEGGVIEVLNNKVSILVEKVLS